jgi:NTP pyrophosphatase (non-canonical NTP hydrolase)
MTDSLNNLQSAIRDFVHVRDWQQFHSPKNLAMALIVEAAELAEHFQWLSQEQSQKNIDRQEVGREMADVLIYLLRMADQLNIDLLAAAENKLKENAVKYPPELARGRADKYNRLGEKT